MLYSTVQYSILLLFADKIHTNEKYSMRVRVYTIRMYVT